MLSVNAHELIAGTYLAATDPTQLSHVLDQLSAELKVDTWHFLGWDLAQGVDLVGLSSRSVREARLLDAYSAHFGQVDPRRALAAQVGPGILIHCCEHFDARFVARNEFYQDFMRPVGLRYSIGLSLHRSDAVDYQLGFSRGSADGPFGADERLLLQTMIGPLMHSVRFADQWRSMRLQTALSTLGLDTAGVAIIGLAPSARVVYANRYAEALLRDGSPVRLKGGYLKAVHPASQVLFIAALRTVTQLGRPQTLKVESVVGDKSLCLMLLPLPESEVASVIRPGTNQRTLLCVLSPLPGRRIAGVRQLMDLFGLTPAEARLARALCAGETLQRYAEDNDVSTTTVKTQLRAVLAKTGASRQSEVVRLVCAVPSLRGKSRDADSGR